MPKILHCIWNFLLFIVARNETSREKPAQRPGVSRSVDGTPGQLSTGLGHDLRQEGEGGPAFLPFPFRELNLFPSHLALPWPHPPLLTLQESEDAIFSKELYKLGLDSPAASLKSRR